MTASRRLAGHLLFGPVLIAASGCGPSSGPVTGGPASRSAGPPAAATPFRPRPGRTALAVDVASAALATGGPTALDGLTRQQIADFRRAKVREHADLGVFPADYDPLVGPGRRIYERLAPGVRWLGPAAYYLANPYLLVVPTCANHVTPLGLFCPDFEVAYDAGRIEETYAGAAARCWLDRVHDPPYADHPGQLRLIMVNAYDAGFRHAHVDLRASENVAAGEGPGNIARAFFSQSSFYHVGRYGANNISPEDRDGWVRLESRTTRTVLTVKLWSERPASVGVPAPLTYRVIVDPAVSRPAGAP